MGILLILISGMGLALLITYFIWMHTAPIEKKGADAIIILGYKCDENQIHPLLKERLDAAIDLFKSYPFKYIILTGGAVTSTKTEAEIMRDHLMNQGIPSEKILLETAARNTVFNIVNCSTILKEYNLQTCLMVSNSFHIRRMSYITRNLHFPASFYAHRNFKTIMNQFKLTIEEITAFRLTLPWLGKVKKMNSTEEFEG